MLSLPERQPCSAQFLRQMLMHRQPDHFMLFVDMFAVGCLLHYQGERSAACTLVGRVFDAVQDGAAEPYLTRLLANLSGNEVRFAQEIEPHYELSSLCIRARMEEDSEPACAR